MTFEEWWEAHKEKFYTGLDITTEDIAIAFKHCCRTVWEAAIASTRLPKPKIPCPECKGLGTITYSTGPTYQCFACEGRCMVEDNS